MGRKDQLSYKLATALPELYPSTWGMVFDNSFKRVPTGAERNLYDYINKLNEKYAAPNGWQLLPEYVDKAGNPMEESPYRLDLESVVSDKFVSWWKLVHANIIMHRKLAKNKEELEKIENASIAGTVRNINKLLAPFDPDMIAAILDQVAIDNSA